MIKSDKEVHAILDEYIPNEIQVVFEIPTSKTAAVNCELEIVTTQVHTNWEEQLMFLNRFIASPFPLELSLCCATPRWHEIFSKTMLKLYVHNSLCLHHRWQGNYEHNFYSLEPVCLLNCDRHFSTGCSDLFPITHIPQPPKKQKGRTQTHRQLEVRAKTIPNFR